MQNRGVFSCWLFHLSDALGKTRAFFCEFFFVFVGSQKLRALVNFSDSFGEKVQSRSTQKQQVRSGRSRQLHGCWARSAKGKLKSSVTDWGGGAVCSTLGRTQLYMAHAAQSYCRNASGPQECALKFTSASNSAVTKTTLLSLSLPLSFS